MERWQVSRGLPDFCMGRGAEALLPGLALSKERLGLF